MSPKEVVTAGSIWQMPTGELIQVVNVTRTPERSSLATRVVYPIPKIVKIKHYLLTDAESWKRPSPRLIKLYEKAWDLR